MTAPGHVSPFNPADAILAQGRYDCSLAALAHQLISHGEASGTVPATPDMSAFMQEAAAVRTGTAPHRYPSWPPAPWRKSMTIPNDAPHSLRALRIHLGLPPERRDGVRDLLAVQRGLGSPVPAPDSWRLALGDWPELWAAEAANGPRFLVMLQGTASPYFIATIEDIDPGGWALDGPDPDPARRVVPVRGTARATPSPTPPTTAPSPGACALSSLTMSSSTGTGSGYRPAPRPSSPQQPRRPSSRQRDERVRPCGRGVDGRRAGRGRSAVAGDCLACYELCVTHPDRVKLAGVPLVSQSCRGLQCRHNVPESPAPRPLPRSEVADLSHSPGVNSPQSGTCTSNVTKCQPEPAVLATSGNTTCGMSPRPQVRCRPVCRI